MAKLNLLRMTMVTFLSLSFGAAVACGLGTFLIHEKVNHQVGTTAYLVGQDIIENGGWLIISYRDDEKSSRMLIEVPIEELVNIDRLLNQNSDSVEIEVKTVTVTGETARVHLELRRNERWAQGTVDSWMLDKGYLLGLTPVGGVVFIFSFLIIWMALHDMGERRDKRRIQRAG